jgi:hypothetical protein
MEHAYLPEKRRSLILNATLTEVFMTIKEKDYVQYPPLIASPLYTYTSRNVFSFLQRQRARY